MQMGEDRTGAGPLVRPRGLGEVVLRVDDLDRSIAFYRDVLGLSLLRRFGDAIAFLQVDMGLEGHARIVGLFRHDQPSSRSGKPDWLVPAPERTPSLHHFALEIPLAEFAAAHAALTAAGFAPNRRDHGWIGWRSLYLSDPDGHVVELVACDPSLLEAGEG